MWLLFKIANFVWLLSSTYMWFTTFFSLTFLVVLSNATIMICMGFLPVKIRFDKTIGRILLAICGLVIWSVWCDGFVMGIFTFLSYLPVVFLVMLPRDLQEDLLHSITKWYAIMIGLGLVEYFITLVASMPSLGQFDYPGYKPYINYGFYIKTTYDYGTFERFNAFFLEPGHQALTSTFLMMANSFRFKRNPYLFILAAGVVFSFSLAGYLLTTVAFTLLMINSVKRAVITGVAITGAIIAILGWNGGDNSLNELIVSRLEYDEEKGIKGNNRFTSDTDFIFEKGQKTGATLTGMQDTVNVKLATGAGFKIYVIKYGWIGAILAALFYLSVIPPRCNVRYSIAFFAVITLCFMQRSYPAWYSWLFPYVLGIYINRKPELPIEEEGEEIDHHNALTAG